MARFIITGEYKDAATRAARKDLKNLASQTNVFAKLSKRAWAIATAAATYYATKGLRRAALAAMEDEKSQRALAFTLTNVVGATDAASIAVEANISAMSKMFGVADDDLRPALARLARVTGNVSVASNDLNLALSLSTATGASLETTTAAITKAYQGNYKSLKTLGLQLDDNLVKNKNTKKILKELQNTYGDFARNQLDTTAVKFNRLKVAAGESSEIIGGELIAAFDRLISKQGGVDGLAKSLEDSATYVSDVIGGASILAAKSSESGFGKLVKDFFAIRPFSKVALDSLVKLNKEEKIRNGLITARNRQIKSARFEEQAALKAAKEGVLSVADASKKTIEQLMAEEAARKAGFKLTEDIDSIQTVAAAKRLEESRQYKSSVIDAAQAQFEAIKRNYDLLSTTWDVQKSAFDAYLAYLKSKSINIPVNFIGGMLPTPSNAPSLNDVLPVQAPVTTAPSSAPNIPVAGVASTINVNVNAGAVGSEQYLADVIAQSLAQAARLGLSTTPSGYIGSP